MDEQRLQAYYQLIQQLLSCPNGEEAAILQANRELLDVDFLELLKVGVEQMSTQEGQENRANRLLALASQLSEQLDIPLTPEPETPLNQANFDTYLQFLLEVLQATAESKVNPQVVYPLLAANTDKLNLTFVELLQVWATKTLEKAEPDTAKSIAVVIGNFSDLIQQFPLGNKADNMEIAITGYEIAFTVFTRDTSPELWAAVQNNLGNAYTNRIRGDKAENLENAIAAYNKALEVSTRTDFPVDWATTQNNLGNAYKDSIRGDKADNLEKAIAAYNEALKVRTRTDFPVDWAATQNNLGATYRDRIRGDKADNLEKSIAAYNKALEVYTPADFPEQWAMTKNTLGNAYNNRIRGDKAENLEIAIAAYNKALEVYTPADFPEQWAMTKNNLGAAYNNRIRGDKAENLENAIAAYQQALEVYTRTDFPEDWARTQNNLAAAYSDSIRGDKAENLEKSIAAYNAALEVYTRTDFPVQWATTQNNLAVAYKNRIRGDKADNLEKAIAAYNAALKVSTRTDFPVQWAMTQNNLGTAYSNRIRGDKADNLENAIAAYQQALEVYTRTDFPVENAKTLLNLGIDYQDSQQFDLAYDTFKSAIATVEGLRGEIISGEESKRKQAEEWNQLFVRMVEVCLALGKEREAISYIERSKTRNLVEQILNRDLKTIFPGEVVTQLEELQDEIASGQNLLQTGKAENPTFLWQHLQQLRQQRQQLQDTYLPIGSSFNFASLEKIVDDNTAIIEWYITFDKIIAFVIQPGGKEITIWQSSSADIEALIDWISEYLANYYNQKYQWQNQLEQSLKKLAVILHIEEILQKIPPQCQKLILIPHRYLHLLPLHALPVRNSYLMDLFPQGVGYAPSCQLLQQTQRRKRDDFQSLWFYRSPYDQTSF
ncbi:MAG: tetratricopeptide repeat protein [Dolichospermum sp.]